MQNANTMKQLLRILKKLHQVFKPSITAEHYRFSLYEGCFYETGNNICA